MTSGKQKDFPVLLFLHYLRLWQLQAHGKLRCLIFEVFFFSSDGRGRKTIMGEFLILLFITMIEIEAHFNRFSI